METSVADPAIRNQKLRNIVRLRAFRSYRRQFLFVQMKGEPTDFPKELSNLVQGTKIQEWAL